MRMFTLIAAGLLLTTVVLMAQNIQNRGHGSFASFDRNDNCAVSGKEVNRQGMRQGNRMFRGSSGMNGSYSHFADIDGNNDNRINEEEFNAHQEDMDERMDYMHSFMSERGHGNWDESIRD